MELLFQAAVTSQFAFPLAVFIQGRNFLVKPSTMLIADVSKDYGKEIRVNMREVYPQQCIAPDHFVGWKFLLHKLSVIRFFCGRSEALKQSIPMRPTLDCVELHNNSRHS
jgi:hypothetical protein